MPRPAVTFSRNGTTSSGRSGTAEGHQQEGVVRRDVGAVQRRTLDSAKGFGRRRCPALDWAGYAAPLLLPPGPRDARRAALLVDRPRGAAADLHGRAGHRLPGRRPGPAPTAWPASVAAAYMVANALFAIAPGPADRPAGPAGGPHRGQRGLRRSRPACSSSRCRPTGRSATSYVAAAAGAARRCPAVGSSVRARWTHVLTAPADLQTAFALEAVVDEVGLHPRPDHRHGAGHRHRPRGRAGRRRGRSAPSAASSSPPSARTEPPAQPARPHHAGRAHRCRGGPSCRSRSSAPRSASCSAPPR